MPVSLLRTTLGTALLLLACSTPSGTTNPPVDDSGTTPIGLGTTPTDRGISGDGGGAMYQATTCGACTPMGPCGWCRRTNRCMEGGSSSSMDMSCSGAAWAYLPSQCSGDGGTTMSCRNVPRTCGLTLSGGVRTCTPGAMVTAGCNQGCSPALGSCTGDAVV